MKQISGNINVAKSFASAPFVFYNTEVLTFYDTEVLGHFSCSGIYQLDSLKGSPVKVHGSFDCSHTSTCCLEGCPRYVGGNFYIHWTNIRSLHNIHKHIDRIGGSLFVHQSIFYYNILGVLKIRDLRSVNTESPIINKRLDAVWGIINRHLHDQPDPMKRNIHLAQEQLIEAGLSEYAEL